ncbi:MAG TPA: Rne/Rng family ribonuclease [Myxococcota bacterium]|nr:Rne/Rng family ribonuclease [Myxococcota bacterium]
MRNELFVNVGPRETRVAVRESDKIVELHIERANERDVVGGIYKGRVTRVLPGMQAAFVDIGLERAGFLYVGDYRSDLDEADLDDEGNGHGRNHRGRRGAPPQIEDVLQEGREVVVQVSKEPLGTKGARITSRISLPGRHLVLMPWVSRVGVSRRIESDRERRRLRALVEKLRPRELGFIVRTVSHGVSEADIKADIDYLTDLWAEIQKRRDSLRDVPALVYSEPALHLRVLRDMASHETKMIVVDDPDAYAEMQAFVQRFMASPRPRITYYNHRRPMFDALRIEQEIEEGLGRKVWLKSGGYLIFDQGEALTAVDVNTGRYTGGRGRNLEDTILKTNLEAVREIVHQLRFRNLGGLIILDLIDMESAGNREKVYRALSEALREDKAKVNILKISELGLVEMTRKRTRESLEQQLCMPCATCEGKGYLQSAATISNRIFRDLPKAATYLYGATLRIQAHPTVTDILLGVGAEGLAKTGERIGREVVVEAMPAYHPEQYQILSEGPRVELLAPPDAPLELAFEDAPEPAESLALEDDGKADELDGDATPELADEPPLDELADGADAERADADAPDLQDV